jgi:hypothetical protein
MDRLPIRLLDDGPSGIAAHRAAFPLGLSSMPALPAPRAEYPTTQDFAVSLPANRSRRPRPTLRLRE